MTDLDQSNYFVTLAASSRDKALAGSKAITYDLALTVDSSFINLVEQGFENATIKAMVAKTKNLLVNVE